jgi:ketosteroid isomerase-like protein
MIMHPNGIKTTEMRDAISRGEIEKAMSYFAPDAVFSVAGNTAVSGTFRGREAIAHGFFRRTRELSGGTIRLVTSELLSNDRFAVAFVRATWQQPRHGDTITAAFSTFDENGLIDRYWFLPADVEAFNESF